MAVKKQAKKKVNVDWLEDEIERVENKLVELRKRELESDSVASNKNLIDSSKDYLELLRRMLRGAV